MGESAHHISSDNSASHAERLTAPARALSLVRDMKILIQWIMESDKKLFRSAKWTWYEPFFVWSNIQLKYRSTADPNVCGFDVSTLHTQSRAAAAARIKFAHKDECARIISWNSINSCHIYLYCWLQANFYIQLRQFRWHFTTENVNKQRHQCQATNPLQSMNKHCLHTPPSPSPNNMCRWEAKQIWLR